MTEYPVQCFDNNGEPYGRYVNPYSRLSEYDGGSSLENEKYDLFEVFSEANTFRMPSGTIGKTYERGEVEVMEQYCYIDWHDGNKLICDALRQKGEIPVRQIFRLVISKTETTTQPVEKEPETVEQAANDYAFKHTLDSGLDRKVRNARIEAFKAGANWQIKQP